MGTVGLSFGSPTGGAGFDVSTTVSMIVANLQNVETPWKTQLTSLESQDTAISNLGALFSHLSNDMSQLTDFTGIMAQKTGSSSDTNVVELTAASSSAIAGAHTVVVTSLATTSSGYLAPITTSTDTLAGSITLQAGATGAQTITLNSSNNTLAGLAAAINSSGVGVKASVLTDSAGSRLSLVSGTSGQNGTIAVSANSIVDSSQANAALGYTASSVVPTDAHLTVDGVNLTSASNTVANLIPGVTFQLLAPSATQTGGGLEQVQVVIGNDNAGVESTVNTMVSDYNSLISAINTQQGDTSNTPEPLFGSPTLSLLQEQLLGGLNMQNPNGFLDAIPLNAGTTISGTMSITVGTGAATPITLPQPTGNSLSDLATAINAANIGVTAIVVTSRTGSSLSLQSQTEGAAGALAVSSSITAISDTPLSYSGSPAGTTTSTGTLTGIVNIADTLAGSISIQVGGGTAQTITLDSTNNTLSGMAGAINVANIGVTATVVANSDGTSSLSLTSQTAGTAGTLTVMSQILDTSNTKSATLNYNNSSDLSGLANLGISISSKYDGSLTYDATTLDSVLNSDYNGVVDFFQNVNSWGQGFSTILANSGTSSRSGILALASSSNSSVESTLNANISKEQLHISSQTKSLTAELNSANEIMQELPSRLNGVNELYSAITGYNQSTHG